jgi:hypothetical protein
MTPRELRATLDCLDLSAAEPRPRPFPLTARVVLEFEVRVAVLELPIRRQACAGVVDRPAAR